MFGWGFVAVSSLVFLYAARELNSLCFKLAPVALGVVFFYSFTKRFTALSHLVRDFRWAWRRRPPGSPCAARSICASCGSRRRGDVLDRGIRHIYACQDYEFDVAESLFSLPRRIESGGRSGFAIAAHPH